jgi:hypothetical protein
VSRGWNGNNFDQQGYLFPDDAGIYMGAQTRDAMRVCILHTRQSCALLPIWP